MKADLSSAPRRQSSRQSVSSASRFGCARRSGLLVQSVLAADSERKGNLGGGPSTPGAVNPAFKTSSRHALGTFDVGGGCQGAIEEPTGCLFCF